MFFQWCPVSGLLSISSLPGAGGDHIRATHKSRHRQFFQIFLPFLAHCFLLYDCFASHANHDGHVLYMRALQQLVSSFYRRG